MKEEVLDRTLWIIRLGMDNGRVLRQTAERINTGVLYRVYFPILAEVVCVKSDQVTVWFYVVGKQANFLSTEDARNCRVRRVLWCS